MCKTWGDFKHTGFGRIILPFTSGRAGSPVLQCGEESLFSCQMTIQAHNLNSCHSKY